MFSKQLRKLRQSHKLTQIELAKRLGLSYSAISMYERGERQPNFETLEAIADFFNVPMSTLIEKSTPPYNNIIPMPEMTTIPLLGSIACGEPITAVENIEDYVAMPESVNADFALRCKGDSMIDARILDGDIVYIHQQAKVENGEIAAVLIGDEATLKRVYISADTITLMPANQKYPPLVYSGEEINEIRILGKAVAFTSAIV